MRAIVDGNRPPKAFRIDAKQAPPAGYVVIAKGKTLWAVKPKGDCSICVGRGVMKLRGTDTLRHCNCIVRRMGTAMRSMS